MPRRAVTVLAFAVLLGLVAALVSAAVDRRELAFTSGVSARNLAVQLEPGRRACQLAVEVVEAFDRVQVTPDPLGRPAGPALRVEVHGAGLGAARSGTAPGGYGAFATTSARVGRVAPGRTVDVCVVNAGAMPVGLRGGPPETVPESRLHLGRGREPEVEQDLQLVFLRDDAPSLLSELPQAFARAALFHPDGMGAWTFWLLLAVVAAGVPALLALALRLALGATAEAPVEPPQS